MGELRERLTAALAERYRIEDELGAGGMATVYLATDLRHGRRVAIKALRWDVTESTGSERFQREIGIAASLTHPHILPLHDSGQVDGVLYYVMPFVEGETLQDRLAREGALPVAEATGLLREILDALGEAHRRGIVHRDVKPSNILLAGGHALVADFGVAKPMSRGEGLETLTTEGAAVGTPEYMAPEQAAGVEDLDHRADLFAAGSVAYYMLTGRSPFRSKDLRATLVAVMAQTPEMPHERSDSVPRPLSHLVMRCLEKKPEDRFQTAAEVLAALDAITPSPAAGPRMGWVSKERRRRIARIWLPVTVALALVAVAGTRWVERRNLERWARSEGIPEVLDLQGENRLAEAAVLAERVEGVLGPQPVLERMWPLMSTPLRIVSDPAGAEVLFREYLSEDPRWETLGFTPLEIDRFPAGAFRFRLELEGFEPVVKARSFLPAGHLGELLSAGADYMEDGSYVIDMALAPEGETPEGMIQVPGGLYMTTPIQGFPNVDPRPIPGYLIDRTEVTQSAYAEFVEAGAYTDASFWQEPFRREGEVVAWEEAMRIFQDSTGRPGPSTWLLGQPPRGQENHPVAGISWFEAEAYCRWRERSLPTLFHWARAALPSSDPWIGFNGLLTEASNYGGVGPEEVGSRDAIGVSGAQDIAGNVREWVSTGAGDQRFLLGGAWSDPAYFIHDSFPVSPWTRGATDGVRCARYPGGTPPDHLMQAFVVPDQDFSGSSPASVLSDEVFAAAQRFSDYDRQAPLADSVESVRELEWGATEEWVTVNAAYGGERLPIRIHLPSDAEPPYEPFIFFGGGNVIRSNRMEAPQPPVDFLVRSGRAMIEPVYDGTFRRNDGRTTDRFFGPGSRELIAHWIQDIGRTIDYLEQRSDIDASRVSFLGLSLGAVLMPVILPYEPRLRAAILYSGGFGKTSSQAGIDRQIAHLRRVTVPVLQLGGRYDFNHPVEPHQTMFFHHLGTPPADKHLHVFDSGHQPLPLTPVITLSVDFLDRYLGSGGSASSSPGPS